MSKASLIEKAVELGLDATGTVRELKDRLEDYRLTPKPITNARIEKNPEREMYRHGAKQPKVRKGPRNLQVAK